MQPNLICIPLSLAICALVLWVDVYPVLTGLRLSDVMTLAQSVRTPASSMLVERLGQLATWLPMAAMALVAGALEGAYLRGADTWAGYHRSYWQSAWWLTMACCALIVSFLMHPRGMVANGAALLLGVSVFAGVRGWRAGR